MDKKYENLIDGNRIAYIGWLGHQNLGDEAMYAAVKEWLNFIPWWTSSFWQRFHKKTVGVQRYFSGVALGGGTVIFGNGADFRDALKLGKPAWTIGTGVQDKIFWEKQSRPWGTLGEEEWIDLLSQCELVTVRGPRSKKILTSFGLDSEVVGDPAMLFTDESLVPVVSNKVIGVNFGSSNNYLWGGSDEETAKHMLDACRILQKEGWTIRLYCVNPNDEEIISSAANQLGLSRQDVVSYYNNAVAFMKDVSRCRVFLSFRLHAGILALAAQVPLVAVEYQPKVADFMESVSSADRCLRSDRLNGRTIAELVSSVSDNADQVSQVQHKEALQLKNNLKNLLHSIALKRCR